MSHKAKELSLFVVSSIALSLSICFFSSTTSSQVDATDKVCLDPVAYAPPTAYYRLGIMGQCIYNDYFYMRDGRKMNCKEFTDKL